MKSTEVVIAEMKEDWGFSSLEQALRWWIATVEAVETGFYGMSEDYVHALSARDYLAELRHRAGVDWPQAWDALIEPWDKRFQEATFEQDEPHLAAHVGRKVGTGWWQCRTPKTWTRPSSEDLTA